MITRGLKNSGPFTGKAISTTLISDMLNWIERERIGKKKPLIIFATGFFPVNGIGGTDSHGVLRILCKKGNFLVGRESKYI